jgi:hypothetical protein
MTRYVRDVLAVPLCLWNTSRAKKEELLPSERIRVPFVSTVNNIADFFTKALPDTYTVIFDKFTHEKVTPVDMCFMRPWCSGL